jgi:hypothetical protein
MMQRKIITSFSLFFLSVMLCLVFLLAGTSCRKTTGIVFEDLPVVEAYLVPGSGVSVKISRKTPYDEAASLSGTDINALDVKVKYRNTWYALPGMGEGVYTDTAGVIPVIPDSTYLLSFTFNGNSITSSTIVPQKPSSVTQSVTSISMAQFDPDNPGGTQPPDPVEITFANDDNSYYFATVTCIDTVLVPVYKDSIPANDIMSSQPVSGTQVDIHPMSIRYFGKNRIVLYHITPEYSTFFVQQASTSQSYQEPPSNIDNGLGIFTGINTDTLYLEVIQTK